MRLNGISKMLMVRSVLADCYGGGKGFCSLWDTALMIAPEIMADNLRIRSNTGSDILVRIMLDRNT